MTVEAAQVQYRQAFIDQFEVRSSVLKNVATVKESMSNGHQVTFLVSGSGTDTAVTRGVNGRIPYGNPTNTQVTATLVERHAPYELTGFNIFASQGNQKEVMRQASMSVINREIDLTILAELANATIDTGTTQQANVELVLKARTALGNAGVATQEEENMFAVVSDGFMAYLMQDDSFANAQYVDVKPLVGPAVKMKRWAGVNWQVSPLVTGVGTSTELCYMWHKNALGYAVNVGEESIAIGYDEKDDTSWTRATIYHAAKILQNTGIVQIKHDGSAFALS